MAEAFVATFKSELVDGLRFGSFEHTEHETLAWVSFYNSERLHEELGDVPPAEYERNFEVTDRPPEPASEEGCQPDNRASNKPRALQKSRSATRVCLVLALPCARERLRRSPEELVLEALALSART